MEDKGIQDLVPFKGPIPITVRVIRKYSVQWNPREKRKLFYLFTDSKGHAVEAKVDTRKKRLDSQVFLYRCYHVTGTWIENCSTIMKRKDSNMLKMWVIDESEKVIEITLWENIAYTYANVVAPGKIVAVTSLRITKFQDSLQLESTSATTIDVDLAIEGYADNIKRLKDIPKKDTISFGFQTEEDIRSNITTLANVLSKEPASVHNHRFACIAAIKEIHGYRTWYSSRCPGPQCNDTVRYEDDRLMCKHCGYLDKPTYRYCVNATLYSDKSTLPVVFFDSAMTQVLGIDCETLVVREGYTDPKVVPKPMLALIGMEKIYSFCMKQNDDAHIQQTLEVKGSAATVGRLPRKLLILCMNLNMQMSAAFTTMLFDGPADTLQIPHDFAVRHFGDAVPPQRVLLIFTNGRFWYVKIEKIGEHFYITEGWRQVVDQIPLRINYYLEFTFEDATTLFMDVSDPTGTNILAMPVPLNAVYAGNTVNLDAVSHDSTEELQPFQAFVTVRSHFRLPSKLAELGDFYDGMKIRVVYENERGRMYKLRGQSNMVTYRRYTIDGWKNFAKRHGIEVIEITLWEDIGYNYVNSLRPGMVTAITSLIVTTHGGKLQLESTSATTVEIEPPNRQGHRRDNITTLQNVVSMNPDSIDATVKEFHGYRKWYRRKCPNSDCDDTLRPEEDYLLCKHCGRIDNPIYTYCVNGTLDDGTATLPVVFFDNAMTQAIGIDCETMVLKNGYEDPKVVPNPILSLAGKEKIYSFSMHKNKDASIQKILEVDSATSTQEVEDISHRPIATAPATPAAKISRKQPTYDPGTQESTRQEYSRRKKAKNDTSE
ncbi:hypothetical protein SSX86_032033 [Deinandra increscens subsp. villosa]|uniref:TF-B3 domain-containing protein n=1 Tax=Deinandra increscens subsp. villosa TaxID=3103831 RepID=A0AAP0C486_9ASTR